MIEAYASRTGTRRNLAALRAAGWGLFVSAAGVHRSEGFRFIIDNGAWTAYSRGEAWDRTRFEALLDKLGRSADCDGIVAPDIVCGGRESLTLSLSWLDILMDYGHRVYLPVQPGIAPSDVASLLGPRVGLFVGGDSSWKESTSHAWSRLAREHDARCHVGRVNSLRRLLIVKAGGAHSFDGSGPSRFAKALDEMEAARKVAAQLGLRITVRADCFFEVDGVICYVLVEVAESWSIDAILLAASDATSAFVFEVQTDAGIYEFEDGKWRFLSWDELEER